MSGGRILSDPQLDRIAAWRERGWGARRIVEALEREGTHVSPSTVIWQCKRLGADLPPRLRGREAQHRPEYRRAGRLCRPWTPADDARLTALSEQGLSSYRIALAMGRANSSVRNRLLTLARIAARAEERAGALC